MPCRPNTQGENGATSSISSASSKIGWKCQCFSSACCGVVLLAIELIWGAGEALQNAVTAIWVIFVLEFVLKFVIAPGKLRFLRKNWLTVLALSRKATPRRAPKPSPPCNPSSDESASV